MPFQSEKQRRFLHANHPEIAKRWEKEYSHGGILDINESEEIISDDGNDIELTDYNAAFDEPTGVKSLFRAKDGGRIGLYQGGGHHAGGYGTTSSSSGDKGGYKNVHQTGAVTQTPGRTTSRSTTGGDGPINPHFDSKEVLEEQKITDDLNRRRELARIARQTYKPKAKIEKIEHVTQTLEKELDKYLNPSRKAKIMDLISIIGFALSPSLTGAWDLGKSQYDKHKAYKDALAELSALGLYGGVPGKEHPLAAKISLALNKMKNWNKDPDDTGGDDPELPPQLGGPSTEEMATEYVETDWLGGIRERQARKKAYDEKIERERLAREENPIVSGTETEIIALRNSGGLANLFRVKNQ